MKWKAYKDNVIVRLDSREERKTASGLILPDSMDNSKFGNKVLSGVVLDAGPGGKGDDGKWHPVDVSVGERILFDSEAGQECIIGDDAEQDGFDLPLGTELRIMRAEEIIGAVEGQ